MAAHLTGVFAFIMGIASLFLRFVLMLNDSGEIAIDPNDPGQEDVVGKIVPRSLGHWKPLETFLYDWWPVAGHRRLYRRLARAQVVLAPS